MHDKQEQSYYNFTPEHIRMSVERSLKRLQTDYLDLVMIHSNGDDSGIINHYGALETLLELKRSGLIRAMCMSTKTVTGGLLALQQSDCVMVTYNPHHQTEKAVIDTALKFKKGILIKKALASGHLCEQKDIDPVLTSLQLILSHPGVSSTIIGTINPQHLLSNVKTLQKVFDK